MNNSTLSFITPETISSFTAQTIGLMEIVEICTMSMSFLLGVPTNLYVVWLIVTGTGSGVALEFFNLNLSICETLTSLNNLVSILPFYFEDFALVPLFLHGLILSARPLFECLICVERYLAVVHPVIFLKTKPLRYRVIFCVFVWIITLGSCFYNVFIMISENHQVHLWFFTSQFLLFLSIQMFCLVSVLRALKQSGPGERRRDRDEENHMKRRAFILILITTVSMFFTYVPYIVTGISIIVAKHNIRVYWVPGLVCYSLASLVQPSLFLHRTGKLTFFP